MLMKRKDGSAGRARLQGIAAGLASGVLDRRTFLRRSGLAAGAGAAIGLMPLGSVRKAQAGPKIVGAPTEIKKNICTHCSVGCTVIAEVQNGVWVGQEPAWDSPINRGSHCAKGASVRELVHGDRRLKYPMKLVNGEWQKISWDQAINEIGDKMLEIRAKSGADSVYLLGSAKFSNEGGYLFRKFAAFWGTNSIDHQARICHSTTVAGVANTWGYGAMTNSYNDMRNSKTIVFMGSNAAEAHPVSLQHILTGKEINRANVFVLDPRFTRTAAHATEYVRFRCGTDIAVIWGMLHHIFNNGWEDKEFIAQRVYGMDQIRAEVAKWTPEEVERVTGHSRRAAEEGRRDLRQAEARRPSSGAWAAPSTPSAPPTSAPIATCCWRPAMSAHSAAAPTSSAATATCRARPISASISRRCRSTTAWSKAPGSTGRASGRSSTIICRRASTKCRRRRAVRRAPASRTWNCRASRGPAGSMRRWPTLMMSTSATS